MQVNTIFYGQKFKCIVRDREKILYIGEASAITTYNEKGVLDVLPGHTHFISIIERSLQIVYPDGKTLNIPITKGILKVYLGEVRVYLGIFSSISKSVKSAIL